MTHKQVEEEKIKSAIQVISDGIELSALQVFMEIHTARGGGKERM